MTTYSSTEPEIEGKIGRAQYMMGAVYDGKNIQTPSGKMKL